MSTALTIQKRHLALPDCACFSPVALEINESCTRAEFSRIGAALVALDTADSLWVCDLAQYAIQRWGKDGLDLCAASTGYTKCTCKKLAHIAERFTPSVRPDRWTRAHFKQLLPFDQSWLNAWIPTVADRKLSASGIRALAVEAFKSDPSQRQTRKKRSVSIPSALYARLVEVNPTQPSALVQKIIEDYLAAAQSAGTVSPPANPTVGNDSPSTSSQPQQSAPSETPRPDYATRRKQQLAASAKCKIKSAYAQCKVGKNLPSSLKPTSFCDREAAEAGNREFAKCYGYLERVVECDVCHAFHLQHIFSGESYASSDYMPRI